MRAIATLLLAAAVAHGADPSFDARELRVSMFADDGRLVRKVETQTARGSIASPLIEKGKVEFYGKEPGLGTIAVMEVQQAQYVRADEVITGEGRLELTTADGVVSGRGYRCILEIGTLDLHADVKCTSPDYTMTGERAAVVFDPKRTGKDDVIRKIILTGNIVVERLATAKAPFDRAESTLARFSADENKVFLKFPITVWKKGEKSLMESTKAEFFEIDLSEPPETAPTPAR